MALTQVQGGMLAGSTNTTTTIQSNGTTAITIDSSQNVGVGSASSGNKFEVAGSGMFSGAVTTNTTGTHISYQSGNSQIGAWGPDTSTNGTLVFFSARSNGVNGLERMRIDSNGNLLINTTSSTARVRADAGSNDLYQGYTSGAQKFAVTNTGIIYAVNTSIQAISDERLKENIKDSEDGLNVVLALKPRRFDWKQNQGNGEKNQLGFIAQEIEKVFPDCVTEKVLSDTDETAYKTVGQGMLIPVLVKAIQELNAKVEAQAAEIAALKAAP